MDIKFKAFTLSLFAALNILNSNTYAQEPIENLLPIIVDLILNGTTTTPNNQAPINSFLTQDTNLVTLNQQRTFFGSVSDIDGNLRSVRVETLGLVGFDFNISTSPIIDPSRLITLIPNGFIVTGNPEGSDQQILQASIEFIATSFTLGSNEATIRITSEDSLGEQDIDEFTILVSPLEETENQAPVNTISFAPTVVNADSNTMLNFNVTDVDNNLSSIRLTSSLASIISPNTTSGVTLQEVTNGFLITGTQTSLRNAISQVSFIPLAGNGNTHTLTLVSTDSRGSSDQDSFNIIVNGFPIIPIE